VRHLKWQSFEGFIATKRSDVSIEANPMSQNDNLKTIARLKRLEVVGQVHNPRRYLRTMADRLVYLYGKLAAIPATTPRPYFQDDEIDAINWLLAQYAAQTGYDVRSVLLLVKDCDRINLARYDDMVVGIERVRQKKDHVPDEKSGK
jgi:hypothetical protein